jgi:type VI secretion system secreted protein Hcp
MARTYYLFIEGLQGPTLSPPGRLAGQPPPNGAGFEVNAFSWGVAISTNPAVGGGGSAGKASFAEITVITQTNAASPNLLVRAASGQINPQAQLIVFDSAPGGLREVERYEFQAAVFTLLRNSGTQGGNSDQQELRIAYRTIKHTVFSWDTRGVASIAGSGGWDVSRNARL